MIAKPPSQGRRRARLLGLAPWALALGAAAWWAKGRGASGAAPPAPLQPGLSRQIVAEPIDFERHEPARGRLAVSPWRIPRKGWRDILWRTWREIGDDRLTVVAGSVTYYTLLAVFPALGVVVSLYGLIADVGAVEAQLVQLSTIFPPEAVGLIGEQMLRLANGKAAGLSLAFIGSLLFSIWSASIGMRSLFDGLNIAYGEREKRGFLARAAMTYGFTLALLAFLTVISGILVVSPMVLDALRIRNEVLVAARWPLVFVVAAAAFTVAYRYGPSRAPARWVWLIPGGLAAAVLWMGGSAGFSWYLNNVARLDVTYGSLGAVIGFMLWVWFSAMVVLIGAELNSEIEHQTALDSTTGPAQAMGERGAVMADTVGLRSVAVGEGLGLFWSGAVRRAKDLWRRLSRTRPPTPPAAPPGPRRSAD